MDISEAEHERYISHLLNSLGKRLEREEHKCAIEKLERELLVAGLRAASRYKNLVNAVRFLEWLEAEGRKLTVLKDLRLKLRVPDGFSPSRVELLEPGAEPEEVDFELSSGLLELTVPELRFYKLIHVPSKEDSL